MNNFDPKTMEKKVLIPWAASAVIFLVCLVIVVLFSAGSLVLTFNARTALGLIMTACMIVFTYLTCKHLGVLKGQKRK